MPFSHACHAKLSHLSATHNLMELDEYCFAVARLNQIRGLRITSTNTRIMTEIVFHDELDDPDQQPGMGTSIKLMGWTEAKVFELPEEVLEGY